MTPISADSVSLLALLQLPGIGKKTAIKFVENSELVTLQSAEQLFETVKKCTLLSEKVRSQCTVEACEEAFSSAKLSIQSSIENEVEIITYGSSSYPSVLSMSEFAPAVLYCKGNTGLLKSKQSVAVVGTRSPTSRGRHLCQSAVQAVVSAKMVVLSGLALGCDTEAHVECLRLGGQTVAVLAGGFLDVQPSSNRPLASEIIAGGGLLISEYCPLVRTHSRQFVERNKIQVGLSQSVIVAECAIDSGTMTTAKFAVKDKKPLACFASDEVNSSAFDTSGNDVLVRDLSAFAIQTDDDLNMFVKRSATAQHDSMGPDSQRSLFD